MRYATYPLRSIALVLAFGAAAWGQDLPQASTDVPKLSGPLKPRSDIGLPNFARISDALYRGAQPTREGFEELKKLGVRTVINLRAGHSDEKLIEGLGLRYISIPTNTWKLTDRHSARFLKAALDPANAPVFVHCQHGSDRTGTMVAVYRIYVQKWAPEDAIRELPSFGFHEIWKNLRTYLKKLDVKKLEAEMKKLDAPAAERK